MRQVEVSADVWVQMAMPAYLALAVVMHVRVLTRRGLTR